MFYFILTSGEYEDRNPIYLSSDLKKFKEETLNYLLNWYDNGCKYDDTPNDIIVMKSDYLYGNRESKSFWLDKIDTTEKFENLFKEIKEYVKG